MRDKPSYRRIELALPALPVGPSLPPFIYFDVDTRFTPSQTNRIRALILIVITFWQQHFFQLKKSSPYLSQLNSCTQKYATHNLTPLWFKGPRITSGTEAINLAMNTLTQRFSENGTGNAAAAKINYYIPEPREHFNIRANTAKKQFKVSLDVTINPILLDDPSITKLNLAGSLLHAWFHRIGFDHPKDIYTTYFIAEAPMCIMRGFQEKAPGQSDAVFTQFFD
ncbi:hypothetical protein [Niallia sp. 01092]|uniref:hypothetical protein n=1 Tax=unclassified Niallia TaxID=2837522 RepID=UPI003FD38E47